MTQYILRRILVTIPTLFVASIVIFLAVRLMPGNVIDFITQGTAVLTPAQRAQMQQELGLNGSLVHQYARWISGLLSGNMGKSLVTTLPIFQTLRSALPITAEIVFLGLLIAVVLAIPLGVLSAVRRDGLADYGSRLGGLIGVSIPNFWFAT